MAQILRFCYLFCVLGILPYVLPAQGLLKSVIYDFEGLNLGQTVLPGGDYALGSLSYRVTSNPASYSEVIGDRVLELKLDWSKGAGTFGKGISRFVELDENSDCLNFYIINSSIAGLALEVSITEDDDKNNQYDSLKDDLWKTEVTVDKNRGWQLVSIPLKNFKDSNSGGNGIFDIGYVNNKGMVFQVAIKFLKPVNAPAESVFYLDMLSFSEGPLPFGRSVTALPENPSPEGCRLGVHSTVPTETKAGAFEKLFPASANRKLKYVHIFQSFSNKATTPDNYPGDGIRKVLNDGSVPLITLEPFYAQLSRLHASQPRLQNIVNGEFDNYLFEYGKRLAAFNDTIILRLMHEFDGNWYPWSVSVNGENPELFKRAFRRMVNVIRSAGADKVQFMWCPNSSPVPNRAYNWSVSAYPGDEFVDVVGTNVYNHPHAGTPDWRSFRYLFAETYYYLTKYFPTKPFIIGELACRERGSIEPHGSQTKAGWFAALDNDLQSYFHQVRGLVFFNENKEHDWRIESSPLSLAAVKHHFWNDDYYFEVVPVKAPALLEEEAKEILIIYPNPSRDFFTLINQDATDMYLYVFNCLGQEVNNYRINPGQVFQFGSDFAAGVYIARIRKGTKTEAIRLIKR
jgi:hypothetical protein